MKYLLLAALVLAGCAGTNFKWEDTEKIHNGMTRQEVVAILGKPYSVSESGSVSILTWSHANAFGGAKAVSYRFVDGKVAGASSVGKK